jgi:hypothetical protein
MTHPGPEQPPQQRPAEPTRAVQLPKMPPPPPGGGQQTPPPPRVPEQAPPPPPEREWAPPAEQGAAPGWAPQQGQGGGQPGWAPPGPPQGGGWGQPAPGHQGPGQQAYGQGGPQPGWAPPGGQPPPDQPPGAPYQGWNAPQPGAGGSSGSGKKILLAVVGVLVVAAVGLGAWFLLSGPGEPSVGDCISVTADGQAETADCDSSDARFKVIGKQDGQQTYEEYLADDSTCADVEGTVQAVWYGDKGEKGTVYCAGNL